MWSCGVRKTRDIACVPCVRKASTLGGMIIVHFLQYISAVLLWVLSTGGAQELTQATSTVFVTSQWADSKNYFNFFKSKNDVSYMTETYIKYIFRQ